MLDAEKLNPGPPLTAYYMNEVNQKTGDLGKPQKMLGFGFSQSGGQIKWLDKIVNKIKRKTTKKKDRGLDITRSSLVDLENDSAGTISTASTSSTDSDSDTSPMPRAQIKKRSSSSSSLGPEGKIELEEHSMESI